MDLLFKQYANPFLIIDEMISINKLSNFVDNIIMRNEEEKLWQYFLHKVYGQSFEEFKSSVRKNSETEENIKNTVNYSFEILKNFIPIESGGKVNGFRII